MDIQLEFIWATFFEEYNILGIVYKYLHPLVVVQAN